MSDNSDASAVQVSAKFRQVSESSEGEWIVVEQEEMWFIPRGTKVQFGTFALWISLELCAHHSLCVYNSSFAYLSMQRV